MDADALPFRPRDRAAYLPGPDALVVADLHLGRGEATDLALPLTGAVVERLEAVVEWCRPETVVLAGDVIHSFVRVSDAVAESFEAARSAVGDAALRVVAGNHDAQLDSVAETVAAHRLSDGTVVCHGHDRPDVAGERYLVGHDHPAIVIEGRRHPCYLYGEGVYRDADVIALPAFNPLAKGTAVNRLRRGDPSSPLLADVRSFSPVVWEETAEETFVFPPLSASGSFL